MMIHHSKLKMANNREQIRPIHPFPARMAPELAMQALKQLPRKSRVLDPMAGSGTVLRHAAALGHIAIGRDMDPLAVLMARVWNQSFDIDILNRRIASTARLVCQPRTDQRLSWIDGDDETKEFVDYWFGKQQQAVLRRLALAIKTLGRNNRSDGAEVDILRLALSRTIITKSQGASLARDTSHSRPHRVSLDSDFDVWDAFLRAIQRIVDNLRKTPPVPNVDVSIGDARALDISNSNVDFVLTSPPYLNAIDYMRGHRLALVWLGYSLASLRHIRSTSIGAERAPESGMVRELFTEIQTEMCDDKLLTPRHKAMIARYSEDVYRMTSEVSRVLKPKGRAVFVVGNSCLKGVFINNARGVAQAASMVGLRLLRETERALPDQHRYLPLPRKSDSPLGRRMRTESIMTFVRT